MAQAIDSHLAEKVGKLALSLKQNGLAANMEEATEMAKRILIKDQPGEERSASAATEAFEEPLFATNQEITSEEQERNNQEVKEAEEIEKQEESEEKSEEEPDFFREINQATQTTLAQDFALADTTGDTTTTLPNKDYLSEPEQQSLQEDALHVEEEVIASDPNGNDEYPLLSTVPDNEEETQLTLDPLEGIDRIDASPKESVPRSVREELPSSEDDSLNDISPQEPSHEQVQDSVPQAPLAENFKPEDFELDDDKVPSTKDSEDKLVDKSPEKPSWSLKRFFGFGKK